MNRKPASGSPAMLSCAIGHSNAIFRAGIVHALGEHGLKIKSSAESVSDLLGTITHDHPDLLFCEATLPGGSGLVVLDELLRRTQPIPVIGLVQTGKDDNFPWGFFQGAVTTQDDETILLAAATAVSAGGTYIDPALSATLRQVSPHPTSGLTAREIQMLYAIAAGESTREIATGLSVSQETVKTHIGNMMRKLGVKSRAEAIARAFKLGLISVQDAAPASLRTTIQGQYSQSGGIPLCTDVAQVVASVLRYLHDQVGFSIWMVTRVQSDDWIILHAVDTYYGIQPGSIYRWSDTFCSRMVEGQGPSVAPSSDAVPAYAEAPIRKDFPIGAYVGVPITRDDGSLFGTLCAIDPTPQPRSVADHLPTVELLARLLGRVL